MKLWRGQPDHDHWRTPFTPREKAYCWWGLSVAAFVSALLMLRYPRSYASGRKLLGALEDWVFAQFGSAGITGLWFFLAGAMFVTGLLQWRKK